MRPLSIVAVIGMACWVSASEGSAVTHTDTAKKTIRGRRARRRRLRAEARARRRVFDRFQPGRVRVRQSEEITCPAHPGNA